MTPMEWVLENSKLSIHNDFRDAPHAQRIAVNPAIEKHDPWPRSLACNLALDN
jgi:hypothetical protein